MRILHLCLACFFVDNYNYQENILPSIDIENHHDVLVIASTETYVDNKKLGYVNPGEYITNDGVHVIRIPYKEIGIKLLTRKIRKYRGLYNLIKEFRPDIIMSHDLSFGSIDEVIRYKKEHDYVKLYADTHTAEYNSGKNWLSMNILHRIIYKRYILKAIPYVEKYMYIGIKEKTFSMENYSVPEGKMKYFPLGGLVPNSHEYSHARNKIRKELGINDKELLLVHSGKLTKEKKTVELIKAFRNSRFKAKLVIIGSIPDDMKDVLTDLFYGNVIYKGWKNSKELMEFLCAADLYCQPGSVSATLQQAICCRCPVLCFSHQEYKEISRLYNCFVFADTEDDIECKLNQIVQGIINVDKLKIIAEICGKELLDYRTGWKRQMPSEYAAEDTITKLSETQHIDEL